MSPDSDQFASQQGMKTCPHGDGASLRTTCSGVHGLHTDCLVRQEALVQSNLFLQSLLAPRARDASEDIESISQHNKRLSELLQDAVNKLDTQRRQYEKMQTLYEANNIEATKTIGCLQKTICEQKSQIRLHMSQTASLLKMRSAIVAVVQCQNCSKPIQDVTMLACGHFFCTGCVTEWKAYHDASDTLPGCAVCGFNALFTVPIAPSFDNMLKCLAQATVIDADDPESGSAGTDDDTEIVSFLFRALTLLVTGCHKLAVAIGRFSDTPRHERPCRLCASGQVEDEKHVLFECIASPEFGEWRAQFFRQVYPLWPGAARDLLRLGGDKFIRRIIFGSNVEALPALARLASKVYFRFVKDISTE